MRDETFLRLRIESECLEGEILKDEVYRNQGDQGDLRRPCSVSEELYSSGLANCSVGSSSGTKVPASGDRTGRKFAFLSL